MTAQSMDSRTKEVLLCKWSVPGGVRNLSRGGRFQA